MAERWKRNNTCVYNLGYHLVWCTKYRRKVLDNGIDIYLKECLLTKAEQNGWQIEEMEIMPEHVHIFIKSTPTDSIAYIVAQLKGYSSHKLRERYPDLWRRLPNLWTRSYYAESCGSLSEENIKKYIEKQKRSFNSSHD